MRIRFHISWLIFVALTFIQTSLADTEARSVYVCKMTTWIQISPEGELRYIERPEAKLERKYEANFIADVKAGNHCPSIMLTAEGMVQYYKDYIERGLLTEEQLRSACTFILEELS